MAKRLLLSAGFLLLVLVASAVYRNGVIVSAFPAETHTLLKVTSNITSFINSIIALLIYAAIFYFAYSVAKAFDSAVRLSDYLDLVADMLYYFCLVEGVKVVFALLFLEGSLVNIEPDETINIQLMSTVWYHYNLLTDVSGLVVLPLFVYYSMRRSESITKRQALLVALALFFGFALLNVYQLLPDKS